MNEHLKHSDQPPPTEPDDGPEPVAQPPQAPETERPTPAIERTAVGTVPGPVIAAPPERIRRTPVSAAWAGLIIGAVITILLLVFVLENLTPGRFAFFGAHFTLPLGVAVLLAGVVGILIMAIVGTARIHQLRRALPLRRHRNRLAQ